MQTVDHVRYPTEPNRQKESLLDDILISRSHILLETDEKRKRKKREENIIQRRERKKNYFSNHSGDVYSAAAVELNGHMLYSREP